MQTERPHVLQCGKMPLPQLDAALAEHYQITLLSEQTDPLAYLRTHGAQFAYAVTTAGIGLRADMVRALPNLQFVSSFGVGYDALDQASLQAQGVRVGYTPGVLDDCVADLAFALMLDVARDVARADRFVRAGQWGQQRFPLGTRVSGKRLGILGMGRIGSAVAKRAAGFDMDIGYHNRRPVAGSAHQYFDSLHALAQWCDFLVITAAGGSDTLHLVDAKVLQALGPKGFLINVARGSVVDEQALVHALQQGQIAGAGLDVFENEPKPLPALFALDNVVLAPHIASGTHETRQAMGDLVLENLASFIRTGQPVAEVPWSVPRA